MESFAFVFLEVAPPKSTTGYMITVLEIITKLIMHTTTL